jgi:hypothetical protein
VFYHRKYNIRIVVHGDDFTILGFEESLDWFKTKIQKKYEIKFRGRLGPENKDDKEIRILNRVVYWTKEGIKYEPDQRHAEIAIKLAGVEGKKSVSTPGCKPTDEKDEENHDVMLERKHATKYRAITARTNYLTQDRLDIKYAVKELCRHMALPRKRDWRKLMRLCKYLIGRERFVVRLDYQDIVSKLDVWTDTDYAGCRETRKSTSGGLIMHGKHVIRGWCATQKIIALSSGEAEYYGIVRGASEGLGTQSLLSEVNIDLRIRLNEDSSAAKGIAQRTGLGKVRHILTSFGSRRK